MLATSPWWLRLQTYRYRHNWVTAGELEADGDATGCHRSRSTREHFRIHHVIWGRCIVMTARTVCRSQWWSHPQKVLRYVRSTVRYLIEYPEATVPPVPYQPGGDTSRIYPPSSRLSTPDTLDNLRPQGYIRRSKQAIHHVRPSIRCLQAG